MPVPDAELLRDIGLSDEELTEIQSKMAELIGSLDQHQLDALKRSLPSAEEAAATLRPEVTAERLTEFMRAHSPRGAAVLVCFNGGGGRS
jgi:hypothetical protein